MATAAELGVVVIGRNEGERLRACLRSVKHVPHRVYVDSGSTDGSRALARELGFQVVPLTSPPNFTAARARNAGLEALLARVGDLKLVQMVDGDCEIAPGWLQAGATALQGDPGLAGVFGRLRERHPDASLYNMMCDEEWNVPLGEARTCGGNAIFRVRALSEANGFASSLIAGEEPDLCLRMRQRGWRILRIDAEMGFHDADIRRFSQWWRRTQRSGHAFAELVDRHGAAAEPHWRRQWASILGWGGGTSLALVIAVAGLLGGAGWAVYVLLGLFAVYTVQIARLALRRRRDGHKPRQALPSAFFLMLGKLPQFQGMLQFLMRRGRAERLKLIEYKS